MLFWLITGRNDSLILYTVGVSLSEVLFHVSIFHFWCWVSFQAEKVLNDFRAILVYFHFYLERRPKASKEKKNKARFPCVLWAVCPSGPYPWAFRHVLASSFFRTPTFLSWPKLILMFRRSWLRRFRLPRHRVRWLQGSASSSPSTSIYIAVAAVALLVVVGCLAFSAYSRSRRGGDGAGGPDAGEGSVAHGDA